MSLSKWTKVVLAMNMCAAVTGCGIIIGNPGNAVEGGETNESFVQGIGYDIPSSVSGYDLAETPRDGIFDDSAKRIDKTIDTVNEMIDRLNHDAVKSVGDFSGKGLDHLVSGSILELTDNETYNYKAVICYKGIVFQTVEWSSITGSVHSIRNHAYDPVDSTRSTDQVSEITYIKDTTSTIDVWLTITADKPIPGADGSILADYTVGTKTDGVYTLAGIHNWFADIAKINANGDEYFSGSFNEDGVGENVTYNAFRPDCTTPFDDTATEHTWCGGRTIPDGTTFTASERAAAAQRLKAIAVPTKTSLKQPVLPEGLSCPE